MGKVILDLEGQVRGGEGPSTMCLRCGEGGSSVAGRVV